MTALPTNPPAPASAAVDLSNCDREPIHIPGSIQPHGYLLALSAPELRVVHGSQNLDRITAVPLADIVGKPLGEVAELSSPELVRAILGSAEAREPVSVT